MTDVSAIVVAWNSAPWIGPCLGSLMRGAGHRTLEVLVVDNASTDGSAAAARSACPAARVIVNAENRGFAAANNQALGIARGRYLLLLNPDAEILGDGLERLVEFMESRPGVWAAGPALWNTDGSPQRTGVRFPNWWNILSEALLLDRMFPRTRLFGGHRELYVPADRSRSVDYVQGSCLLVRREAMQSVGMLDERFFMYFEETDWCYRMRQKGGEVWVAASSRALHHGGGPGSLYDEAKLVHYHRSLLAFYAKHYGRIPLLLIRPLLILRSLLRVLLRLPAALTEGDGQGAARSAIRGHRRVIRMMLGGEGAR
ncbi:MAG: glycosyltransferase family 2 protein [Bacteroidota bacterium]